MKYIGKYGEYLVLLELLKREIESYLAIKVNQDSYDITVVLDKSCVVRLQVKATKLHNDATNNPVSNVKKDYDYLALVVVEENKDRIFILTKDEVLDEMEDEKRT